MADGNCTCEVLLSALKDIQPASYDSRQFVIGILTLVFAFLGPAAVYVLKMPRVQHWVGLGHRAKKKKQLQHTINHLIPQLQTLSVQLNSDSSNSDKQPSKPKPQSIAVV